MPPTMGAAMGFITSEPMPVSHRIGARLASTAQTVISLGRRRCTAPSMAACFNVSLRERMSCRNARSDALLQRLVEIDHHHHARLHRNAEERDVADGNGHAEVIVQQPLQQQPSRHRVGGGENEHEGLCHRVKDKIEQQKNYAEHERQNQLEPLLGTLLKLILPRPLIGDACGKIQPAL